MRAISAALARFLRQLCAFPEARSISVGKSRGAVMNGRAGRIVAVVVTAAVLAVSTSAAVADVAKAPGWKHALWIRSDALNRVHHLGDYRLEAMNRS